MPSADFLFLVRAASTNLGLLFLFVTIGFMIPQVGAVQIAVLLGESSTFRQNTALRVEE
jgi:hypothetical protein